MDIEKLLKSAPPLGTPARVEWNRSLGAAIDIILRDLATHVRQARRRAVTVPGRSRWPHQDQSRELGVSSPPYVAKSARS